MILPQAEAPVVTITAALPAHLSFEEQEGFTQKSLIIDPH